jgi:hypothetical protein
VEVVVGILRGSAQTIDTPYPKHSAAALGLTDLLGVPRAVQARESVAAMCYK